MLLERNVSSRRRWPRRATSLGVAGVGALALHALIARPEPMPATAVVLPAPPIVIAVPAPAPAPAPPPPPVVVPPPPPLAHVGCPAAVASIGVPAERAPPDVNARQVAEVSVSTEGCTLAARVGEALDVSWDAGASFDAFDAGHVASFVAVDARLRLLRDDGMLGTLTPDRAIRWQPVPSALTRATLLAAGPWVALAAEGMVGITDDGGASWRFVETRKAMSDLRLRADGTLVALEARTPRRDDDDMLAPTITSVYTADSAHVRWRASGVHSGSPIDEELRYATNPDRFWGCGGSVKLVDFTSGDEVEGDLRDDVWPIRVHTTRGVTFATVRDVLVRLDDGGERVVPGELPGELVAVDAAGTPIVRASTQLLRWSKDGGWRVLLDDAGGRQVAVAGGAR